MQEAASHGSPFIVVLGHGYSTPDNTTLRMKDWLTQYAADPAHRAQLIVSPTCRRYAQADTPWGSTRLSTTADGDLVIEERVEFINPDGTPPPGPTAQPPGYYDTITFLRDGHPWKLDFRAGINDILVRAFFSLDSCCARRAHLLTRHCIPCVSQVFPKRSRLLRLDMDALAAPSDIDRRREVFMKLTANSLMDAVVDLPNQMSSEALAQIGIRVRIEADRILIGARDWGGFVRFFHRE